MSKSKKKAKGSNDQKRSNKFMANKLRTNQSKSAFKAAEEAELKKVEAQQPTNEEKVVQSVTPDEVITPTTEVEQQTQEPVNQEAQTQEQPTEVKKQEAKEKEVSEKDKQKEKDKKDKQKKKEKEGKRKFGSRTKETIAELKRVTWPTFKETMKKTGLVIAVVLFFGVALFAIERLLSWLYTLLTSGILN